MKKPWTFVNKIAFKRRAGKCEICSEKDYDLLHTHRIVPQKEYSNENCVCLCTSCHTLTHKGRITVIGWKNSSAGKLFHYIDENGEEHLKKHSL